MRHSQAGRGLLHCMGSVLTIAVPRDISPGGALRRHRLVARPLYCGEVKRPNNESYQRQ